MSFTAANLIEENRFINRIRFFNGRDVNLSAFREILQLECDSNGIPAAFADNTLKTGSLFNKQVEDVLVVYNPEHPTDYFQFLVRITHQGEYAFLDVFQVGISKNFARENKAQSSLTQGVFNKFSGHSQKFQEEVDYYTILADCMNNTIS